MKDGQDRLAPDRFMPALFGIAVLLALGVLLSVHTTGHGTFYVSERETQTAISSYYIAHEGYGLLDYITPVMGYPWQVPMEFPLYQWLAARIANPLLSLDDSGRGLALAFLALGVWGAYRLVSQMGVGRDHLYAFLVLASTSPLYLAYGFSFTIETTAMCLGVWYLERYVSFERTQDHSALALAAVFGVLAALVKATTWVVFAAPIGIVAAWTALAELRRGRLDWRGTIWRGAVLALPLAAGLLWTAYSDGVKLQNPIASGVTSGALGAWNYGTLSQKLSPVAWGYYLGRSVIQLLGVAGIVVPPWMALVAWRRRGDVENRRLVLLCLVAFLVGPAIFTNLYFEHDYYVLAGGLFLIAAFAMSRARAIPRALLVVLVVSNLWTTYGYLKLKQINYEDPAGRHIVRAVRDLPVDTTLIVLGSFFDSYVPYYSEHKALQTPIADFGDPVYREALQLVRDRNVGAVITKGARYFDSAESTARELGLQRRFDLAPGVRIHYRAELERWLSLDYLDTHAIAEQRIGALGELVGRSRPLSFRLVGDGGPAAVLSAGGNLYLFDLRQGARIVHHRWYLDPDPEAGSRSR